MKLIADSSPRSKVGKTIARLAMVLPLVGMLLNVISCSKQESTATATAEKETVEPAAATSKSLTIFTWGDYFEPETLKKFTETTGIVVDYQTYDNSAEMIGLVRSDPDRYDIIITDDSVIANMNDLSLLAELDVKKIPNAENVDKKFRGLEFDPENKLSLPYMWGNTVISYRKDLLGEVKMSWDILLDERCKGKVYVTDDAYDILGVVLLKLGHDLNTQKPEDIEQARGVMHEIFTKQGAKMANYEGIRAAMKRGDCMVAVNYNGDAALDAENIPGVDFFVPEEGTPLWVDSFAVTRDSLHRDEAHEFINYMLEPKNAAQNSNFTRYATPVTAAKEFVNAEIADDNRIYLTPDILEKSAFYAPGQIERNLLINTLLTELHKLIYKQGLETAKANTEAVSEAP